jgi:hypothetical protein
MDGWYWYVAAGMVFGFGLAVGTHWIWCVFYESHMELTRRKDKNGE